jgi:hypothetical protein
VLDDWTTALSRALGVDVPVDADRLLRVAGDAAHQVARPAAPLTTFLVGYAAATRGGGAEAVEEACRQATELATSWDSSGPPPPGS